VAQITNDASAAAESKEVARLKDIIKRLRTGQVVKDLGAMQPALSPRWCAQRDARAGVLPPRRRHGA
jgi:hypothetical protein